MKKIQLLTPKAKSVWEFNLGVAPHPAASAAALSATGADYVIEPWRENMPVSVGLRGSLNAP